MVEDESITTDHSYANLVPRLTKEEYESLKESIKQNGLWVPLIVNRNGILLDGYHRYKACQELGIKNPKFETKTFDNELDEKLFVIDCNLKRRQLTDFQKIELALKSKPILEEIAKGHMSSGGKGDRNLTPLGRVDEQVGRLAGVSRDTVRKVEKMEKKPGRRFTNEMRDKLRSGEVSINHASYT